MAETVLDDSILKTIRKMVGPSEDYYYFDPDLIVHINTVFSILNQIGLGSDTDTFKITGDAETWSDFLGEDHARLEMVKSYMYFKIKIMFDPPQSSFVLDSYKKIADELEWRIGASVDPSEVGAKV